MTDERRAWTIRIRNWREFQNYKDRHPPWIKLHQARLLDKPEWRRLHGSAAKLLVDLWMLAAGTKDGALNMRLTDLAYRLRAEDEELLADLRFLETSEFVELSPALQADASKRMQVHASAHKRNPEERRGEEKNSSTPKTGDDWVPPFAHAWENRFQGSAPWGRIGKALKPLRAKHSDTEMLAHWTRYLAETEAQYATAERFAQTYGEWAAKKSPRDNYLRPEEVA